MHRWDSFGLGKPVNGLPSLLGEWVSLPDLTSLLGEVSIFGFDFGVFWILLETLILLRLGRRALSWSLNSGVLGMTSLSAGTTTTMNMNHVEITQGSQWIQWILFLILKWQASNINEEIQNFINFVLSTHSLSLLFSTAFAKPNFICVLNFQYLVLRVTVVLYYSLHFPLLEHLPLYWRGLLK